MDSDIERELRNFGYESRDQVYLGLERKHIDFKKSLEKRRSKIWQRFREFNHQEIQTNRSVNEKLQGMLPIANENNHSAVVRALTNKDIETSNAAENMRGNETPAVEMENIDVPASLLDNLGKISEENITDNRVRRQRTKTKYSEMQVIGLNNLIGEVTSRVERKNYVEVARNDKTTPSPKVSVNFSDIVSDLLESNKSNSSMIETSPPRLCTNSAESPNSSNVLMEGCDSMTFSTQDRELVSILEDLQNIDFTGHNNSTETSRLKGYFCSETVFNLSKKVLTEAEIKVLEKGLDYAPIQNKVNEPELRSDFEEFCRRMRLKWYFRNDPTPDFSEKPSFTPKSSWKPPTGHPNLEVFLSELEKQIFKIVDSKLGYSNFSKEEWQAMRALADDRSIVIKKLTKAQLLWFGTVMITY